MGPAPRWLFRAARRLHAIDLLRGGSLVRWLDGGSDPVFRLGPGELSRPWYTTLVLALAPVPIDLAQIDKALDREGLLAEAAVLIAADSTANVIAHRELGGLFLQRSDGEWVKFPTFEIFPPTVGLGQSEATLRADARGVEATLRSWNGMAARSLRIEWALKGLLSDEPWSQFVWLMFSLDQLVTEHHAGQPTTDPRMRADAETFVRSAIPNARLNWRSPSITMKFAALAANVSRASAAADTVTFYGLMKRRNRMLHGAELEAPDGATRELARDLTLRYNKLFSIGVSAAAKRP